MSPCPAPRSPSLSARTPLAPPQNFTQFLVEATGSAWTLGTSSIIKWPATARAGNGNGGVAQIIKSTPGAIGYVDYADAKASGLTFASIKNKAGDYVAPSVVGGLRGCQPGHRQARPDVQRDLGARRQLVPDHRSVVGSGLPDPAERERRGHAQGVHRLPARRRPATAPQSGLRAAARQHRPDGHRRSSARSACNSEHCDTGRSDRLDHREHCDEGGSGHPGRIRRCPVGAAAARRP